jgi:hypothetical protein
MMKFEYYIIIFFFIHDRQIVLNKGSYNGNSDKAKYFNYCFIVELGLTILLDMFFFLGQPLSNQQFSITSKVIISVSSTSGIRVRKFVTSKFLKH